MSVGYSSQYMVLCNCISHYDQRADIRLDQILYCTNYLSVSLMSFERLIHYGLEEMDGLNFSCHRS